MHVQADNREGYDALLQGPDGKALVPALGYEVPKSGPTTNFVGNHMTQVVHYCSKAACTSLLQADQYSALRRELLTWLKWSCKPRMRNNWPSQPASRPCAFSLVVQQKTLQMSCQ